jgi:hypothetical protein
VGFLDWLRDRPASEQPTETPRPRGGSGRNHTEGFLELEEFNQELAHPQSHDVFDRMARTDADVSQVLHLAVNPITGGTWDVEPFGGEEAKPEDVDVADAVRWALFEVMTPNLLGHLIEFLPVLFRSGFCPGEVIWRPAERDGKELLVPARVEMRLPRSILKFHQADGQLTGVTQSLPFGKPGSARADGHGEETYQSGGTGPGEVFLPRKNLVYYRVGAEGDNWEGVSLLRPAYKHWKIKDAVERIDAIAQEREAIGIPVVYRPTGADDGQLDSVEAALKGMRSNEQAYILMPGPKAGEGAPEGQGWLIDIIGYNRQGTGRDPRPTLDYHTNKIAAAFIAEFMRLGHGESGARATAQVQADPFLMSIEALVTGIEASINEALVLPFVAYNFPKATNAPRLKMSLVDSTSLSQLADFVLKLTQVGALLPDQPLEDFLRARADLPPANPEAIRRRKDEDDKIRRMIVGGDPEQPEAADPFGSNDAKGRGTKHTNEGGLGKKKTGAPAGAGGAGKGTPRGPAKNLDAVTLSSARRAVDYAHDDGALRPFELTLDLYAMADELDAAPQRMRDQLATSIVAGGVGADMICQVLEAHYDSGFGHVHRELGLEVPTVLSRGVDDGRDGLKRRAAIGAKHVSSAMELAREASALDHGADSPRAQAAAEKAGLRAAERVGRAFGTQAFQQGRHDAGVQLAAGIMGSRYTSVLDGNRCGPCGEADDGQVRALDDPIRMDRRPPNRHCDSTHSGHNLCRCIEVFEPMPPDVSTLAAASVETGGPAWPDLIAKLVTQYLQVHPGAQVERALRVVLARVELWANGGGRVSASMQQAAAEALRQWRSM